LSSATPTADLGGAYFHGLIGPKMTPLAPMPGREDWDKLQTIRKVFDFQVLSRGGVGSAGCNGKAENAALILPEKNEILKPKAL
jgi:hypothetical protein